MDNFRPQLTGRSRCWALLGGSATILALVLLPSLAAPRSELARGAPAGPGAPAAPGAPRAQGSEPEEIWWNEEWARLVNVQGSWAIDSGPDRIVMRPEGLTCRLDVLAMVTGRMHGYEFDSAGEVVIAHGWIMIAEARACAISGAPDPGILARASLKRPRTSLNNQSYIESVELHGPGAWELQLPAVKGLRFQLVSPYAPGQPSNWIVVNMSLGEVKQFTNSVDFPLLTIMLSRTKELGEQDAVAWIEVAANHL